MVSVPPLTSASNNLRKYHRTLRMLRDQKREGNIGRILAAQAFRLAPGLNVYYSDATEKSTKQTRILSVEGVRSAVCFSSHHFELCLLGGPVTSMNRKASEQTPSNHNIGVDPSASGTEPLSLLMAEHAHYLALGLYDGYTTELLHATPGYLDILERAHEYARKDLIGRERDDLPVIELPEKAQELFTAVLESGKPLRLGEVRVKLPRDKIETIWDWSLTPIQLAVQEPTRLRC